MAATSWLARPEIQLARVLPRADRALAFAWWTALLLRGLMPAAFALAMGALVGAVQEGRGLGAPLALVGTVFVGGINGLGETREQTLGLMSRMLADFVAQHASKSRPNAPKDR
jgi:hypothetical protein